MFTAEYEGINSFLVGASSLLLDHGVKRTTRGYVCWELPEPFMFKIKNPTARWVTIPERKWNLVLPYAESLWLANGRNDLKFIGHYLKNMKNFSDDGVYLRGGYGPRLRMFNGLQNDYTSNEIFARNSENANSAVVDQFDFIEKSFKKDRNTRQAIISIGDPLKDCFTLQKQIKETKDTPCTRILHFMKHPTEDKLNLTVYMRSNDILWGSSAVNIFNFTFMLEYFAQILNLEVGDYYHIANSFHYYENFKCQLEEIANANRINDFGFTYNKSFTSLRQFDDLIKKLSNEEESMHDDKTHQRLDFQDDFFNDWLKVLELYNTKQKVEFVNPILNELISKSFLYG